MPGPGVTAITVAVARKMREVMASNTGVSWGCPRSIRAWRLGGQGMLRGAERDRQGREFAPGAQGSNADLILRKYGDAPRGYPDEPQRGIRPMIIDVLRREHRNIEKLLAV